MKGTPGEITDDDRFVQQGRAACQRGLELTDNPYQYRAKASSAIKAGKWSTGWRRRFEENFNRAYSRG